VALAALIALPGAFILLSDNPGFAEGIGGGSVSTSGAEGMSLANADTPLGNAAVGDDASRSAGASAPDASLPDVSTPGSSVGGGGDQLSDAGDTADAGATSGTDDAAAGAGNSLAPGGDVEEIGDGQGTGDTDNIDNAGSVGDSNPIGDSNSVDPDASGQAEGSSEDGLSKDAAQPAQGAKEATSPQAAAPEATNPKSYKSPSSVQAEQTAGMEVLVLDGETTLTSQRARDAGWVFRLSADERSYIIIEYQGDIPGKVDDPLLVPQEIDGKPVTEINTRAFVKEGLREYDVISVSIPPSIQRIGQDAFKGQDKLEQIIFSEGLRSIGASAFEGTGLTSVSFPESIGIIGDRSFSGTTALASIEIPNRTITLGSSVFSDTTALEDIVIPGNLLKVPQGAFKNSGLSSLALGEGILIIDANAFEGVANLVDLKLPSSLQTINERAFADCIQLETLNIPASVTSMAYNSFEGVPRTLFASADAGTLGVAHLRGQKFENYEVTARSEDDQIRVVFRKDVLPDDVEVSVTAFSDEIIVSYVDYLLASGLTLASSYHIALTTDGVPTMPSAAINLSLAYDPAMTEKALLLFSTSQPSGNSVSGGDAGKDDVDDPSDPAATGDPVVSGDSAAPDDSAPPSVLYVRSIKGEGYLSFAHEGTEQWFGDYLLCYPSDTPGYGLPGTVDPDEAEEARKAIEEKRKGGFLVLRQVGGGAASAMDAPGPNKYGDTEYSTEDILGDLDLGTSASSSSESDVSNKAVADKPVPQSDTASAAPIAPPVTIRIADLDIPVTLLFGVFIESIVLGVVLFYLCKAFRMRRVESSL
jgi:hypothetical protein